MQFAMGNKGEGRSVVMVSFHMGECTVCARRKKEAHL